MKIKSITNNDATIIKKSRPEGFYTATITGFNKLDKGDERGLYELTFTIPNEKEPQSLTLYGARITWSLAQLAELADIEELSDTDQLIGKTVKLFYQHKYFNKNYGTVAPRKEWVFYKPIMPKKLDGKPVSDEDLAF